MTPDGAIPDWLNPVPFGVVGHGQLPGDPQQWDVMSEDQLQQMRLQLLESILSSVVQAVRGIFFPGPFGAALDQLIEWASLLLFGGDLLDAINGEYEGDNPVLQAIELILTPVRWIWQFFGYVLTEFLKPVFLFLQELWNQFVVDWNGIDWTTPLTAIHSAWMLFVDNVLNFFPWLINKIEEASGLSDIPNFLATDVLREVWATFNTDWAAINFTSISALWDALRAVLNLIRGTVHWLAVVFRNLTGIDLENLLESLGVTALAAAFTAWANTLIGINWLGNPVAGLMTAIGAFITLFQDIGNWFLALIDSWLGWSTATVHDMFSSFQSFVESLVRYFFGDSALASFTSVIDNLAGGANATLTEAIEAVSGVLEFVSKAFQPLIDTLFNGDIAGDVIKEVVEFFNGVINASGSIAAGIPSFANGVLEFVSKVFQPMIDSFFNGDTVGNVIKEVVEFFNGVINTFGSVAAGIPSFTFITDAIIDAVEEVGGWVFGIINTLTGGLFGSILDGLAGLAALVANIPLIGPIISALVPPDWRNSIGLPASSLADLKSAAAENLTTSSVLYSNNLYGPIPVDILPVTGAGDVADYKPNLVSDPSFRSAAAVQAGEGWSWDSTTSRTVGDGGSAKLAGDGGVKQMFSNRVAVSPGQELEVSVYTKWEKPSAARPTISVGLRAYNGDTILFTNSFASQSNVVSNSGWVQLKGTYAIPTNTAMTHVRLSLSVLNAPTGTSVWFDEAALRRISLIQPSLVGGVGQTSDTLADDIENTVGSDQFDELLRAISRKTGYTLDDVRDTVEDFLDGNSDISGDQIAAGNIAAEFINDLGLTWDSIYRGVKDSAPPTAGDLDTAFSALASWRTVIASAGGLSSGADAAATTAVKRVDGLEKNYADLKSYVGLMADDIRKVTIAAGISPTTPPTPPGDTPINFISVNDNFDRAAIGSGWSVTYRSNVSSALVIPDGTNAFFQVPEFYNTHNTFSAVYQGGNSRTEYQRVYCTLGSAPGRPGLGSIGYNDLLGRVAGPNQCIVARFYGDTARTVRLFWRAGGLEADPFNPSNQFGTFTMPSDLTSGSVLEFYVGNKSVNDQTKCFVKVGTWTSGVATMNATALASMGRAWGFGGGNGLSVPFPLSASQYAGKVNFWGAQDQ